MKHPYLWREIPVHEPARVQVAHSPRDVHSEAHAHSPRQIQSHVGEDWFQTATVYELQWNKGKEYVLMGAGGLDHFYKLWRKI